MDVNLNSKNLDDELNKLVLFYESGNGYGTPEGELEHQRKFQLLMHRQNLKVKRQNIRIITLNVILTTLNIGILIYQVFF